VIRGLGEGDGGCDLQVLAGGGAVAGGCVEAAGCGVGVAVWGAEGVA